jgi:hypothetical protein
VCFFFFFLHSYSIFTWFVFQVEMFIGLLLRAMKSDVNLKRVAAFAKRVLQVSIELHSFSAWSFFEQMLNKSNLLG